MLICYARHHVPRFVAQNYVPHIWTQVDGWSATQKVKKSHPAAYELAVTANLREVSGTASVRIVLSKVLVSEVFV